MNTLLIAFVGLIYFIISVKYFYDGNPGLGIVFLGYSFSNYGLYLAGKMI